MTKTIEPLPLVRIIFLAFIKKYPDSSGYALSKKIKEVIHNEIEFNSGTVYNELRRMEHDHLVTSYLTESNRKTRNYRITEQGEKELEHLLGLMKKRVHNILLPLLDFIETQ